MSWTQPICETCYSQMYPGREAHRIRPEYREQEVCCLCGASNLDGIYVRLDPNAVPYPASDGRRT